MNTKIYLIPVLALLLSCVSKNEFEEIQNINDSLRIEIQSLKNTISDQELDLKNNESTISYLNSDLKEQRSQQIEIEKELNRYKPKGDVLSSRNHTEQEAINTVNDYFDFYERDYVVRNIKVRRKSNASFWVSYEKASRRNANSDFFYSSETKILEFYENNKYQLKYNW